MMKLKRALVRGGPAEEVLVNEAVEIHTLEPRVVAFHRKRVPYTDIPGAIDALLAWVAEQGLAPSMVVGTHHLRDPRTEDPEWEAFVEVTPPSTPWASTPWAKARSTDAFGVRELPETTFAVTVHRGPLDRLGDIYERLEAWVAEHGYVVAGPPEEIYVSAPDVPLTEGLTEVRLPVRPSP
jgi:effector-binding domain-containing protein